MVLATAASACFSACRIADAPRRIALATTTSVEHSGLLDVLVPAFQSQTGIHVNVVTPGSGIALQMLARGDVDVAISHAPAREAKTITGTGRWTYRKIMFNHFVIVGPPQDPAAVVGSPTVEEAMRRIARSKARFISRGDSSGTHERERDLWRHSGLVAPENVVVAGSGMGATLRIAGSTRAYTLTDRATFSQHSDRGDLIVVFEGSPLLLNTYAAIMRVDALSEARLFMDWLSDGHGRVLVDTFRTPAGQRAFHVWPSGCPRDRPELLPHGCRSDRR